MHPIDLVHWVTMELREVSITLPDLDPKIDISKICWPGPEEGWTPAGGQIFDFSKILGIAWPIVENTPTSLETSFKLSRGPQRPYTKSRRRTLTQLE